MGWLTALLIQNLKKPGRSNDGDGLFLKPAGPSSGYLQFRASINGRRRDIGLGSLGQMRHFKVERRLLDWVAVLLRVAA